MRTETRVRCWARFKWSAWVRRFTCALIRATDSGIVVWQVNQRRAWCVCPDPDLAGGAFSVSLTKWEGGQAFMFRASYVTFRDGRWMQCETFFVGDGGERKFPMEKLWRAIRKFSCHNTKGGER